MRKLALALAASALAAPALAENLRICVEGDYPPFSFLNDAGQLEGFDIDMTFALCDAIGATCALVQTDWDSIIPSLEQGRCDAIIASMSITEERKQRIDFTAKYYDTPARFAAAAGVDWEDTDAGLAGKTVCVQRGTIHQAYMEGLYPSVNLVLYPTQDEVYLDLTAGRCDAIIADSVAIDDGFLKTPQGEGYAFFGRNHNDPRFHGEGTGIAVRKGEGALRDRFTAAIEAIRASGVYQSINDKWFDFDIYGG